MSEGKFAIPGQGDKRAHAPISSSSALASFRSSVSKPSLNQLYTGARSDPERRCIGRDWGESRPKADTAFW
jgi:hypothetical protein